MGLVGAVLVLLCGGSGGGRRAVVLEAPSPTPSDNAPPAGSPSSTPSFPPAASSGPGASVAPVSSLTPCQRELECNTVANAIAAIDPAKMNDHLIALTSFGSRDPRHPGHAKAVAYIKEQLGALTYYGWTIESQRTVYQGIPLENIFASIEGATAASSGSALPPPPPETTLVLVSAHYDSIANRTPGWRPALDPAPGADDNATGTAALLEFARVVSIASREQLRSRLVLAFFDGEELFFKGSAAYVASLAKPYKYKAAINLDMVGFNPLADRLDLLWDTSASPQLRDRVLRANQTHRIGVSPPDPQVPAPRKHILDAAPLGIAGIPSIALCQRYGENDATFPGNYTFPPVADTPPQITKQRPWPQAPKP